MESVWKVLAKLERLKALFSDDGVFIYVIFR